MVAEHADEQLGIFGRVGHTMQLTEGEKNADKLDEYLSSQVSNLIEDDTVLKQINAEIKEITEAEDN